MDAKILDQVTANTVGNCKMMIVDLNMESYTEYTISNIPFTPQAIICAKVTPGAEYSTTIIKPMSKNYFMQVKTWEINSIVVYTDYGGNWYFIILG